MTVLVILFICMFVYLFGDHYCNMLMDKQSIAVNEFEGLSVTPVNSAFNDSCGNEGRDYTPLKPITDHKDIQMEPIIEEDGSVTYEMEREITSLEVLQAADEAIAATYEELVIDAEPIDLVDVVEEEYNAFTASSIIIDDNK